MKKMLLGLACMVVFAAAYDYPKVSDGSQGEPAIQRSAPAMLVDGPLPLCVPSNPCVIQQSKG